MKLIAIGLLACASLARATGPAQSTAPAAGSISRSEVEAEAAELGPERCALTLAPKEGILRLKAASKSRTGLLRRGCEAGFKTAPPAPPPAKVEADAGAGSGSMLFDGLVKS